MEEYSMKKSEYEAMKRDGNPHILVHTRGHIHLVALDNNGYGRTNIVNNHYHTVLGYSVKYSAGHTHKLKSLTMKDTDDPDADEEYDDTVEFGKPGDATYAVWSRAEINLLPDSSFAWIETGGSKDEEGKTIPRSLRHLPYKDKNGKIDVTHLRNALARVDLVSKMPDKVKENVRAKLEKELETAKHEDCECQEMESDDIIIVNHSLNVHNIEKVTVIEHTEEAPAVVEIEGILFHRGDHKGFFYTDDVLKKAKLMPKPGNKLVYTNRDHKMDESKRVGVLSHIWWDEKAKWHCPRNRESGVGAVKYRSIITDPEAISEIMVGKLTNISAEMLLNTVRNTEGREQVLEVGVAGMAITNNPHLPAADISKVCTIQQDGTRVCDERKV